jgi:hypothetical protein
MKTLVAAMLFLPALAQAQTLPGSSDLDDSNLRAATWQVSMTLRRGDQMIPGGTTKSELVSLPGNRWAYITQTTTPLGTATDTSIVMQRTLAPISHRSHAVPRTLALDYSGTKVTGAHTPKGGAPTAIARVTEVPAFDAGTLELILASLPLAAGYTTRLPLYIEEQGGLVWLDVTVTGDAVLAEADGWAVRATNPKYTLNFVFAKDDHRFLGGRVDYPNGAVMEISRK